MTHSRQILKPTTSIHFFPEILIQLAGATEFATDDGSFTLGTGEICIIPRGVHHKESAISEHGKFEQWVLMPLPHGLYCHFGFQGYGKHPIGKDPIFIDTDGKHLTESLDQIIRTAKKQDEVSNAMVHALLVLFFGIIIRAMDNQGKQPVSEPTKITECRRLVALQLREPTLSIKSIARQLRCSADYLSNLFHQTTGMTLSCHIRNSRIKLACDLLQQTDFNIKEVSYACGFSDASYFGRQFKAVTNITPSAYQKQCRTQNKYNGIKL
jgi:AraC-like DNA-binding protein